MKKTNLAFIGAGNMASAIIKGISKSDNANCFNISAFDVDQVKLIELEKYGVIAADIQQIAKTSDFIFLAVKPQNIEEVLTQLKPIINKSSVIVSIAAGISAQYIKKTLEFDAKVVLAMPNTPLLINLGATAVAKAIPTLDQEFKIVLDIFNSCGICLEIPIDKMKEIIPINGSAPAFIYLYAKGFVEYANSVGIDEKAALKLFCATLEGSAKMMTETGFSIDELIAQVSSKGGTTVAGLGEFNEHGFLDIINSACKKCTQRAYELSKN